MKKNGFIATSVIYSFFIVFITLFIGLIVTFIHNRLLISKVNEEAKNNLSKINEMRFDDFKIGDYVKFSNKEIENDEVCSTNLLNENAVWNLAYIDNSDPEHSVYYFFSDLTAQNLIANCYLNSDITTQNSNELKISRIHPVSIDVFRELETKAASSTDPTPVYSSQVKLPNLQFTLITTSMLKKIKSSTNDERILNSILNAAGDYAIYCDETSGGFLSGNYYNFRKYSFDQYMTANTNLDNNYNILPSYCGGTVNENGTIYDADNEIGFIHKTTKAFEHTGVNDSITTSEYVDYCYYSSLNPYTHSNNDLITVNDGVNRTDDITDTYSSVYGIRLMAYIKVDNGNKPYIYSGHGTSIDPYIIMDGSGK